MSIDSDCKEKFILSRKIEATEEELDDGEDETDDDLEEKNTMIWIGLRFNQTNSRFEWQNGAKFEHDMWVSSCSIYPYVAYLLFDYCHCSVKSDCFQSLCFQDLDQPLEDDYLGDKACVAVNRTTGLWSMQSCSTKYRFYCQHEKYIRHERESDLVRSLDFRSTKLNLTTRVEFDPFLEASTHFIQRVGVCNFSTKQYAGLFGGNTAGAENKEWYHFRNKCYFPGVGFFFF